MCQGFSHFPGFLHHCVLTKLATSTRIKTCPSCSKSRPIPRNERTLLCDEKELRDEFHVVLRSAETGSATTVGET